MKTRNKQYMTRGGVANKFSTKANIIKHQPTVHLRRIDDPKSTNSPSPRARRRNKVKKPFLKSKKAKIETKKRPTSIAQQPQLCYNKTSDFVMFALDPQKKCYAVKMFPTAYDPRAGSLDDYLTQSIQTAERLCWEISRQMCNISRYDSISECNDISPSEVSKIADYLAFEATLHKHRVNEKRLRDLNKQMCAAMTENRFEDCLNDLDDLMKVLKSSVTKLMLKKQPRIVDVLLYLASQELDEYNDYTKLIREIALSAINRIKQIFGFKRGNKEFKKWFLNGIELFTKLTAHLSVQEKFELINDPIETVDRSSSIAARLVE